MPPVSRMDFAQGRQVATLESCCQPHQGRPQTPMHIGDLAQHEPTNEDVAGVADGAREPEDLVALGVAPPASPYRPPRDGLGEARDRSPSTFENDAVAADEREGSLDRHLQPAPPQRGGRADVIEAVRPRL